MLIYAKKKKKKSYFHYKSLKVQDCKFFVQYILFNILSNCALKIFSIEINFLCILLFYEFLMFLSFFQPFFFP